MVEYVLTVTYGDTGAGEGGAGWFHASLAVSAHLGSRFDPTQLCRPEVSPVMELNVFQALFGIQEVEAALGAAVRNLHLHGRIQEAIRDTQTGVCVCVCAGGIPGGC